MNASHGREGYAVTEGEVLKLSDWDSWSRAPAKSASGRRGGNWQAACDWDFIIGSLVE
jgi:hypothetical protein